MRPAGISGPARRVTTERGNDAKRRSAVWPLSVEAVEFSPALVPEKKFISGRKAMSSGAGGVVPVVAEVYVSASANEEDKLLAQASGQHVVCNTDPGKVPVILSVPTGDTLVNKPSMVRLRR